MRCLLDDVNVTVKLEDFSFNVQNRNKLQRRDSQTIPKRETDGSKKPHHLIQQPGLGHMSCYFVRIQQKMQNFFLKPYLGKRRQANVLVRMHWLH